MTKLTKLSPFWTTWYSWKSLRMPWRKEILAGHDLDGNTYWEFNDVRHGGTEAAPTAARMRRIVKFPRGTHPGSVMVSPMWHQWLRHVRFDAPSIQEQQMEVRRQEQMRLLAARANERWANAKRVEGPIQAGELLEMAGVHAAETADAAAHLPPSSTPRITLSPAMSPAMSGEKEAPKEEETKPETKEAEPVHAHAQEAAVKDDPWNKARDARSEQWQPAAWTPAPRK